MPAHAGIHALLRRAVEDVDGRHDAGHDGHFFICHSGARLARNDNG
jgi:hypothetical protein